MDWAREVWLNLLAGLPVAVFVLFVLWVLAALWVLANQLKDDFRWLRASLVLGVVLALILLAGWLVRHTP